eukprot:2626831-Prymnesium_polylepis.2
MQAKSTTLNAVHPPVIAPEARGASQDTARESSRRRHRRVSCACPRTPRWMRRCGFGLGRREWRNKLI